MALLLLAGCQPEEAGRRPEAFVRVATAEQVSYAPAFTLTGEIKARVQSDLSFRLSGRITQRLVEIGTTVKAGQPLARLDPSEQQADVEAAAASVRAAEAQLRQASATFDRQKTLFAQGFTTRRDYDTSEAALRSAQASLTSAQAQAGQSRDLLTFTTLTAPADGTVTARFAEVGQVVQAAQPVFTLAHAGARDALFQVNESLFLQQRDQADVRVALVSDPEIRAAGRVREVAPSVDPATGTVRVTVGLDHPPADMTLGAIVAGSIALKPQSAFIVPWTAMTVSGTEPAIWVMDAESRAVTPRAVTVIAYETERVVIGGGPRSGELYVADGVKLLRPNQIVTVLTESRP